MPGPRSALFTLLTGGMCLIGISLSSAAAAGGGGCHRQTSGAGTEVNMAGFCFDPTVLHVDPGTSVSFTNRDQVDHVVVGTGWALSSDLRPGDSASHRFDDPGLYAYACYLHPGMNGVVVVGDGDAAGDATADRTMALAADGAGGRASDSDSTGAATILAAGAIGAAAGVASSQAGRRLWPRLRKQT